MFTVKSDDKFAFQTILVLLTVGRLIAFDDSQFTSFDGFFHSSMLENGQK